MPKTLNIAVIGAGTMAQSVHLPVLRRRWDRFKVTALVDHSPRRRRESSDIWGVQEEKRFESVADLISAIRGKKVAVDAVVLSTDGLHVKDLIQLMRRGLPVLVEPPLGFSAEEIREVADFERMTGRRLVMMAYPQQHDEAALEMVDRLPRRDIRMLDYEVLMPAAQPLFGAAHVTASAYDLPSEVRTERRTALQDAVVAGAGEGATQRDRDLYVKGLLTGVAHQLAVLESTYGPLTELTAVRHWPKGVIPGSIEILGELESGAPVHLVWHYLPFAAEYSEKIQVISARRRMRVELKAPSHGDTRSTLSLREKSSGVVTETGMTATRGSAEAMWEAFHAFVEKGTEPVTAVADEVTRVALLREVLAGIVGADGRSLDPEPEPEETTEQSEQAGQEETAENPAQGESAEARSAESGDETPEDLEADEASEPAPVGEPQASEPQASEPQATGDGAPAPTTVPAAASAEQAAAESVTAAEPGSVEPESAEPSAEPSAERAETWLPGEEDGGAWGLPADHHGEIADGEDGDAVEPSAAEGPPEESQEPTEEKQDPSAPERS